MKSRIDSMNMLDRAIGWFSPSAGLSRVRARAAMEMVRSYDGAKTGRRTDGWTTGGTSANAEIAPALSLLRSRSRDLLRNNPYAVKARQAFVGNAIGTGITAKFAANADLWARWIGGECDADGQHDFFGLQMLAAMTEFESGECLIRLRWRRPDDGLAVPLQLQVLEPDYLDTLKNEALPNGGWIMHGVEFDALGRRVGYWLYDQHPGDNAPFLRGLTSRRIPATDILHLYRKERPGQVRGVPRLAPVMLKMRDTDDYEEAELVRKGIEACFAAIVTNQAGDDTTPITGGLTDASGRTVESMAAGMVYYAKPGQDIKFGSPAAVGGYGEFIRQQLHAIAAGAGLTYELLTGDLSMVNYSSYRAGVLEFRRAVEQYQWITFIPMFCAPVAAAFQRAALLQRGSRAGDVEWTTPKWDWVDPVKDVAGELLEVAAGLKSWQEAVRRRGMDPDTVLAQTKEDQQKFKDAGVAIQIDKLALGAAAAAAPAESKKEGVAQ